MGGVPGALAASSPPPRNECFRACKTKAELLPLPEKIRRTPSGAGKDFTFYLCSPARPARFPGLCANPESATKDAAPPSPPPNPLTPARSRRPRAPPAARRPLLERPAAVPRSQAPGARKGRFSRHEARRRRHRARLPPARAGTGAAPPGPHPIHL